MKYLIYKISGGLNHMLLQINNMIWLSKLTNRYLIIDCMSGAFNNDFNNYFHIENCNYSTNYQVLYDDFKLDKLFLDKYIKNHVCYKNGEYYLLDKITSMNSLCVINNNDDVIFCSFIKDLMTDWKIFVNPQLMDINLNQDFDNYVGIHYRNTDMTHDIIPIIEQVQKYRGIISNVYLATDDYDAYNIFDKELKNDFKITQNIIPYNNKGMNIHYGNPNKREIIIGALTDMYYLIYADYFIPSYKSSFSQNVNRLRQKDDFFKKIKELKNENLNKNI